MQWSKSLTISNFLSVIRMMLIVPIFQGLSQNSYEGNAWALFYMLLAVISDFLDGFLARKLDQISDLGRLLDPLADKVCIIGVSIILALPFRTDPLPMWFLILLLAREVTILTCGYLVYHRRNIVVSSNIWGKSTSAALAAMLISYVLNYKPASPWLFWLGYEFLLWLSFSFIMVSAISYSWRFYKLYAGQTKPIGSAILNTKNATGSSGQSQKTSNN